MAECPVERNTTIVDMPKCRGGSTGEICRLYYDSDTRQQVDADDHSVGGRQLNPDYKPEVEGNLSSNPFNNVNKQLTTHEIDDVVTEQF